MLVELSVVEQRYHAVDIAERYGVSRKTAHAWLCRYGQGGLPGLADQSHPPHDDDEAPRPMLRHHSRDGSEQVNELSFSGRPIEYGEISSCCKLLSHKGIQADRAVDEVSLGQTRFILQPGQLLNGSRDEAGGNPLRD
jgi:hypothetical protein